MSKLAFPKGLYGITPEWDDTDKLLLAIEQAALGGMVALQWRRKNINPLNAQAQALAVVNCCKDLKITSIINDSYELAQAVDSDGVHLGKDDDNVSQARKALGENKIIGVSCYNDINLAKSMLDLNVDYIAFGAMFPSGTKPNAVHANIDILSKAKDLIQKDFTNTIKTPAVIAIGGINPDNALQLINAGADSIAVIQSLFGADNINQTANRYSKLFNTNNL